MTPRQNELRDLAYECGAVSYSYSKTGKATPKSTLEFTPEQLESFVERVVKAATAEPELHEIIDSYVRRSDKTNTQIALEVGFNKPNVVSMIRTGSMQLPWKRAAALAKSLNMNVLYLLRRSMPPEDWNALVEVFSGITEASRNPRPLHAHVQDG